MSVISKQSAFARNALVKDGGHGTDEMESTCCADVACGVAHHELQDSPIYGRGILRILCRRCANQFGAVELWVERLLSWYPFLKSHGFVFTSWVCVPWLQFQTYMLACCIMLLNTCIWIYIYIHVVVTEKAKVGRQRGLEHNSWCLLHVWHLLQLLLQDATWPIYSCIYIYVCSFL